ncbi:MAG: DUF2961 domain-containing protein [Planctomycetia bacterium]|jgi:hypothetical protein
MKKNQRRFFLLLTFMTLVVNAAAGMAVSQTVTFDSLLDEMVDRAKLASFPSPAYTCKQASSYDRRSVSPDKPGWFANIDNSIFLRTEEKQGRKELVIMDVKGPGAIVRWWVTHKNNPGTLRLYIDGATEPTVEGKIDDFFGGDAMVGEPLCGIRGRGRNLFLPIPYAKRCKITYEGLNFNETKEHKDRFYYQINYRDYPAGTKVESFTGSTIVDSKAKIDSVQKKLSNPELVMPGTLRKFVSKGVDCKPGKTVSLVQFKGAGAIAKISFKVDPSLKNLDQVLRSTVIKATFDGQQTIWCPLGDFFGCGVGLNPYKGWYRQVEKDGTMTCRWVMPYKESCEISLDNLGKKPVSVIARVAACSWEWTDHSMYFHTSWRQQRNIETPGNGRKNPGDHAVDWNYLTVEGRGVYVGDTLALFNDSKSWWGEGDEKIYVDGEKFPSHFGTGTEDYYGYAWGDHEFFDSPFHAQPRADGPRNFGNITNTRVRLLDDIPFTKSYKIDMEIWHWAKTTVDYAVATYWYGRPGAKGNYGPQLEEASAPIRKKTEQKSVEVARIRGFWIKRFAEKTNLVVKKIGHHGPGWIGGRHLWWTEGQPGDKLELCFRVKAEGDYDLTVCLARAPDYGIVQFYVDGKKVGLPVDLYGNTVHHTGPITIDSSHFTKGDHNLTVEIIGANPNAIKKYMFGIDRLELKKKK